MHHSQTAEASTVSGMATLHYGSVLWLVVCGRSWEMFNFPGDRTSLANQSTLCQYSSWGKSPVTLVCLKSNTILIRQNSWTTLLLRCRHHNNNNLTMLLLLKCQNQAILNTNMSTIQDTWREGGGGRGRSSLGFDYRSQFLFWRKLIISSRPHFWCFSRMFIDYSQKTQTYICGIVIESWLGC